MKLQHPYLPTGYIFAFEFLIWVPINVGVLPTQASVTGPANSTLRRHKKPFRNSDRHACEVTSEQKCVCSPDLARDGPVPLRDALGIDITWVGQAVAAADLWLAALHLISGETCLTAAAVIGALRRNEDMWFLWTAFVNPQKRSTRC